MKGQDPQRQVLQCVGCFGLVLLFFRRFQSSQFYVLLPCHLSCMYHCHVICHVLYVPCHLSCIVCTIVMSFVMYCMYHCHVICHVLWIRLVVFVEYLHTEYTDICLISEFGFKNKKFKVLYIVILYLSKSLLCWCLLCTDVGRSQAQVFRNGHCWRQRPPGRVWDRTQGNYTSVFHTVQFCDCE